MSEDLKKDFPGFVEEHYDERDYVNFKWVETLATVFLVIAGLAVIAGSLLLIQSLDSYSDGYGVIGGATLVSGLVSLFMGALLKVLVKIEENTRL